MQESAKSEEHQPLKFSLKSSFEMKSTWLVIAGALIMAISPFFAWATATVSVPLLPYAYTITVTGYDATWNVAFGPQRLFRMAYFQLASLALALLALLLRIFPLDAPKWVRSTMLIMSGILGIAGPIGFIYAGISQAQRLSSQFQWLLDILKTLNIQLQYNFSAGPGLILALAGPVLLLIGGVIVFREKK